MAKVPTVMLGSVTRAPVKPDTTHSRVLASPHWFPPIKSDIFTPFRPAKPIVSPARPAETRWHREPLANEGSIALQRWRLVKDKKGPEAEWEVIVGHEEEPSRTAPLPNSIVCRSQAKPMVNLFFTKLM